MKMLQSRPRVALALAASVLVFVPRTASAQNKPFPQNGGYANGFLPSSIAASDALSAYNSWKTNYLKSDCGNGYYRVDFDSPAGTTVSEGMGYGMVLTAYFGDKTAFDGLFQVDLG